MTIQPDTLFAQAGLKSEGSVPWGRQIPEKRPGVYVIASRQPAGPIAPLDIDKVRKWTSIATCISVDGQPAPSIETLCERLGRYWQPGERILYVGLAGTSLRNRVGQFIRHTAGYSKPHRGGFWFKLLNDDWLSSVDVIWASTDRSDLCEYQMIRAFASARSNVDSSASGELLELVDHIPFANLQIVLPTDIRNVRRKALKHHGLSGHTVDP